LPGRTKDMEKYVDECNIYQKIKNQTEAPTEKLMVNQVLEKP